MSVKKSKKKLNAQASPTIKIAARLFSEDLPAKIKVPVRVQEVRPVCSSDSMPIRTPFTNLDLCLRQAEFSLKRVYRQETLERFTPAVLDAYVSMNSPRWNRRIVIALNALAGVADLRKKLVGANEAMAGLALTAFRLGRAWMTALELPAVQRDRRRSNMDKKIPLPEISRRLAAFERVRERRGSAWGERSIANEAAKALGMKSGKSVQDAVKEAKRLGLLWNPLTCQTELIL